MVLQTIGNRTFNTKSKVDCADLLVELANGEPEFVQWFTGEAETDLLDEHYQEAEGEALNRIQFYWGVDVLNHFLSHRSLPVGFDARQYPLVEFDGEVP